MPIELARPLLVGVNHSSAHALEESKRVLESLQPGSHVGLEVDYFDPRNTRINALEDNLDHIALNVYHEMGRDDLAGQYSTKRKEVREQGKFFRQLAEHAQRLGHTVHWLESPVSRQAQGLKLEQADVERVKQQLKDEQVNPNDKFRLVKGLIERHNLHNLNTHWAIGLARTRFIKRFVERKKDWKPTDAIFVGAAHAIHFQDHFQWTIHRLFPPLDEQTIDAVRRMTRQAEVQLKTRKTKRGTI